MIISQPSDEPNLILPFCPLPNGLFFASFILPAPQGKSLASDESAPTARWTLLLWRSPWDCSFSSPSIPFW